MRNNESNNKRYRVEMKSKSGNFRVDCTETKLEYWKQICKYDANIENGVCCYREFPLTKSEKIYF